jgi:hypothetical protein
MVRAGDDPHAAVLAVARTERQPDGDDAVVCAQPPVPVGGVLVPGGGAALERLLGDEVARPQGDIGTHQRLHDIEDLVRQQEVEQSSVAEVRGVQLVGQLVALGRQVLLEDGLEHVEPLRCEQGLLGQEVAVGAEELDVLRGQHEVVSLVSGLGLGRVLSSLVAPGRR